MCSLVFYRLGYIFFPDGTGIGLPCTPFILGVSSAPGWGCEVGGASGDE